MGMDKRLCDSRDIKQPKNRTKGGKADTGRIQSIYKRRAVRFRCGLHTEAAQILGMRLTFHSLQISTLIGCILGLLNVVNSFD
jgi:hypothetical protein